jgi:hypothetical protein
MMFFLTQRRREELRVWFKDFGIHIVFDGLQIYIHGCSYRLDHSQYRQQSRRKLTSISFLLPSLSPIV